MTLIDRAIEEQGPQVVAIEKPYMLPTKRAAILSVIEQELRGRAEDLGLRVVELTPEEIRQAIVGNSRATKIDMAEALVAPSLETKLNVKMTYPFSSASLEYPKMRLPIDQGGHWTFKPAPLNLAAVTQP